jgi:DNA-binding NarL/FixJ family response regulator
MGECSREAKKQLRVVIADDSALMRRHLEFVLSKIEALVICGVAEDGAEAVLLIKELYPDVAVLDISMPYRTGIEVLREIRQDNHSTIIIMFTADLTPDLREVCFRAGANFFLDKGETAKLVEICKCLLAL